MNNFKTSVKDICIKDGWLTGVEHQHSPHFSIRESTRESDNKRQIESSKESTADICREISLLVVHNISLPPAQFGGPYITDLFLGKLDENADPYFKEIAHLKVSAHCLIRRDGKIIQYVSFNNKAWHAGVSAFDGREQCNDFSIGIELEGTDDIPYTEEQYQLLALLVKKLQASYPLISHNNIVGHCDIAPNRKTDPGQSFNWHYFRQCLNAL